MDDEALEELALKRARSYGTGPPEDEEARASLLADCARAVGADDSRFCICSRESTIPHWQQNCITCKVC